MCGADRVDLARRIVEPAVEPSARVPSSCAPLIAISWPYTCTPIERPRLRALAWPAAAAVWRARGGRRARVHRHRVVQRIGPRYRRGCERFGGVGIGGARSPRSMPVADDVLQADAGGCRFFGPSKRAAVGKRGFQHGEAAHQIAGVGQRTAIDRLALRSCAGAARFAEDGERLAVGAFTAVERQDELVRMQIGQRERHLAGHPLGSRSPSRALAPPRRIRCANFSASAWAPRSIVNWRAVHEQDGRSRGVPIDVMRLRNDRQNAVGIGAALPAAARACRCTCERSIRPRSVSDARNRASALLRRRRAR